jgi:predicted RNA-binding protein with RPS1 domain
MALGGIYKDKDLEDLYKTDMEEEEPSETRIIREEEPEEERKKEVVIVRKREARPQMEEDQVESLRRMSPEVIGSLFDRVKFLNERIQEIKDMIKSREEIHSDMVKDIDADIREKENLSVRLVDLEDKRNIKLDISVLRKEKRSEIRQYWRDLMELRTELQELMEQHRNEAKIAGLFKDEAEALTGESSNDTGTGRQGIEIE